MAAYFRGGSINQPGQTEAVDHDGVSYIVMANDKGVLAVYKAPRIVRFVDTLPKSGTGKILWRQLQEQERARLAATSSY